MAQLNYQMLLIEGWANDKTGHLTDYFFREFKKLEKEGYSLEEVYTNLKGILKDFRTVIDKEYNEELSLWHQYKLQPRKKGEPINVDKPKKEHFSGSINLLQLTNGKYRGFIMANDVDYIENRLVDAVAKINKEKIADGLKNLSGLIAKRIAPQKNGNDTQWTALTYLLCKYFENGCKIPKDSQVEAMITPGVKKSTLKNKHTALKKEDVNYNHTEKKLSIKAFAEAYELLMEYFTNKNEKAYNEIEKKYKVLKETYAAMLV